MLTGQEQKEMMTLSVKCLDSKDWQTPLPDADKKDLRRLECLLRKQGAQDRDDVGQPQPQRIKNYVQSPLLKQKIEEGAEFQGVEMRNHGTEEKPMYVIREWMYAGAGEGRRAAFIQYPAARPTDAQFIEAGKTIAASAFQRFSK